MAKLSRATLKTLFSAGASPTEDHFADLIDSSGNTLDDSGVSDINKVVHIFGNPENDHRVISLYHGNQGSEEPVSDWDIGLDKDSTPDISTLLFRAGDKQDLSSDGKPSTPNGGANNNNTVLTLTSANKPGISNKVGINTMTPAFELDVNGVVRMSGRLGTAPDITTTEQQQLCADGQWHNITAPFSDYQSFEVMARVVDPSCGNNALIHGVALYTPDLGQNKAIVTARPGLLKRMHGRLFKRKNKTQPAPDATATADAGAATTGAGAATAGAGAATAGAGAATAGAGAATAGAGAATAGAGAATPAVSAGDVSTVGISCQHSVTQQTDQLQLRWLKVGGTDNPSLVVLQIRSVTAYAAVTDSADATAVPQAPAIRCLLTRLWVEA
ncbi:MAG: hypothetical protein ACI8WB_001246 [Phenylobacterium sp.]|jgi:hypothetical protein